MSISIYFKGKHGLAINHKPLIKGQSNWRWDGVKMSPFSVTISPAKAVDKDELVSKLLGEAAGNLSGAADSCRMRLDEKRSPNIICRPYIRKSRT